jgi:coenzyme PQQ biosynthesis protein PqqD
MSTTEELLIQKPTLIRNCRVHKDAQQKEMLLMPEGVLQLKGAAADIVKLCDGKRTLNQVIQELQAKYPAADAQQVSSDAVEFLMILRQKRVLDFT